MRLLARTAPKTPRRPRPLTGLALALGCLAGAQAAPPSVATTDLGLLNGGTYASARAVNAGGLAIGLAQNGDTLSVQQVVWKRSGIAPWSDCCGFGSGIPVAINRSGEAAGYIAAGFDDEPLYWDATGTPIPLPPLPGGIGRGAAYDINDAGQVVGSTRDAAGRRHAVIWERTTLSTDLGFMGEAGPGLSNQSIAHGINAQGVVVGESLVGNEFHAFVWQDGVFTDLGPGSALDITDTGLVVGYAPGRVPVLWRSGVREYLPALSGAAMAFAHTVTGMNQHGDVVGYAPTPQAPYQDTAVAWANGRAYDLGRHPGGNVSRAYGINDRRQVVGEGNLESDGPMHALRWTLRRGLPPVVEQMTGRR